MSQAIDKKLAFQLFSQMEEQLPHPAYELELNFYQLVREGNLSALQKMDSEFAEIDHEKRGKLSNNPLRNLRYHLIVTISMITRFCMEGGLDSETAYTLSDLYIQKADLTNDYNQLKTLHKEVTFDFATRMQQLQKKNAYSKLIVLAINYIQEHLQEPLTVPKIAAYLKHNETYIAKQFKKETQFTISQYILIKKMEVAKRMLLYSDYSCADIANFLSYTSQSYFIQVFKKQVGMTPLAYRNTFFRKQFVT